ncbi:MAG: Unknown protein [uncultured Sulfurovum sp.]|uniref:PAS domain-containing protein n=1 Tax=uncultured Sulfurovum sp. TaxID=269237 RepID=A0A6S6U4F4_9BACT|nr:MAG: Unknown protein [uncultured Sulfurovum sp.]
MNTTSINFQSFVEWDNSPFILFSNEGRVVYLNANAEVLLGYVSQNEMYDIALSYAPKDFGYKTTLLQLSYHTFQFYSITVGYENEEQLSLRLYNTPRLQNEEQLKTDTLATTDINILLEANLALFKSANSTALTLLTDQDLPPFKIEQNNFSKLLRKSLDIFCDEDAIHIELKLIIGQYILIDNKKRSIVQLTISSHSYSSNISHREKNREINILAKKCHITPTLNHNRIMLEIPFIE